MKSTGNFFFFFFDFFSKLLRQTAQFLKLPLRQYFFKISIKVNFKRIFTLALTSLSARVFSSGASQRTNDVDEERFPFEFRIHAFEMIAILRCMLLF